jgi:hypothetical protein
MGKSRLFAPRINIALPVEKIFPLVHDALMQIQPLAIDLFCGRRMS